MIISITRHFVSDSTPVILWMNERYFVDLAQKVIVSQKGDS